MGDLERALSRNTMLLPAISFATGIAVSASLTASVWIGIILFLISMIGYIAILSFSSTPLITYRLRNYHYIWLCAAFMALGILNADLRSPKEIPLPTGVPLGLTGEVIDIQEKSSGDQFILRVSMVSEGKDIIYDGDQLLIKVIQKGGGGNVVPNDVIQFTSLLKSIDDNPNSFIEGYKKLMNGKGIYYETILTGNKINIISHRHTLSSFSYGLRNSIETVIENTSLSKPTQNFLITLLLGDRTYLDPELRSRFSDAGVSHVLALSGMHISIIGGIFFFILFPFNFIGKYKFRYGVTVILIWGYAIISGLAPSTVRACIMLTFAAIGIISERKSYALNALSAAVLVILFVSPVSLWDAGFQLSVLCVASLILFSGSLNILSRKFHPRLYKIAETLSATIIATFASWILTCYYFHSFPLSFLPANLVVLPALPIYLVIAIIYIAISAIGIESITIKTILDRGFDYLQQFLCFIGENNSEEIAVDSTILILWISALIILAIYINLYRLKTLLLTGISLCAVAIGMITFTSSSISAGSFIVTNSYREISVNVKLRKDYRTIKFPRYRNSHLDIDDKRLVNIDKGVNIDRIPDADILIVGSGFKGDFEQLIQTMRAPMIIIHPSIRRKRENEYLRVCKDKGVECHSLRHQGPYKNIK